MRILVTALALLLAAVLPSPGRAEIVDPAPFDSVLARHLAGDQVNYGALAREPGPLRRFLAACAAARPDTFPRAERFAFWVNAYNARVLAGVIDRPGLRSVLDVGKVAGVPTLAFFRARARTGGRTLSLNDIEHRILRGGFADPRIHFVLNCASVSCPALPARALRAATLEATLDTATRAFLADTRRNRVAADGRLELSSIFRWYGDDFRAAGGVPAFVAPYLGRSLPPGTSVRFLPYDWSLNGTW